MKIEIWRRRAEEAKRIAESSCAQCQEKIGGTGSSGKNWYFLKKHDKNSPKICSNCYTMNYRKSHPEYVKSQRIKSLQYQRIHRDEIREKNHEKSMIDSLWNRARKAADVREHPWKDLTNPLNRHIRKCYEGMFSRVHSSRPETKKYYAGLPITVTMDDFYKLAMRTGYPELFKRYIENGRKRGDAPSVDRINSTKGYVLGNIRFIPQRENCRKASVYGWKNPKRAKGGAPRGENHGGAKLHDEDISKIRKDKRSARVIANDYGVGIATIYKVKSGKGWTHV